MVIPKKILAAALIVAVLIGVLLISTNRDNSTSTEETPVPQEQTEKLKYKELQSGKIGETYETNYFAVKIEGLECGKQKVGSGNPKDIHLIAQGQFCILTAAIKNTTRTTRDFVSDRQYLMTADGTKFLPDLLGTSLIGDPWGEIEKGETITAKIVYDVPWETEITTIELRDTPNSGVRVLLEKATP